MKKLIIAGMAVIILSGCSGEKESSSEPVVKKVEEKTYGLSVEEQARTMKIEINELTVNDDQVIAHLKLDNEQSSTPVSWDSMDSNLVIGNTQLNASESPFDEMNEPSVVQEGEIKYDIPAGKDLEVEEGTEVKFNLGEFVIEGNFPDNKEINTTGTLE